MCDVFSDIFARRDNALTRLNPRIKLLVALVLILMVVLSRRLAFPLTILCLTLSTMLCLRIPLRLLLQRLAAPLGVVLVLVVVQAFTGGETAWWTFSLAGWEFTATREGAARGGLLATRVLAAVSVILLLSLVTFAHQIFGALRAFKVPDVWVEVAMLMYRYVFALLDTATDVTAAQHLRLGYSSPSRSLTSLGTLGGVVLLRSLDQATRTHTAMTTRGYRGTIPFAPLPPLVTREHALLLATVLTSGLAFCLLERLFAG